jgi:hypothetical protein
MTDFFKLHKNPIRYKNLGNIKAPVFTKLLSKGKADFNQNPGKRQPSRKIKQKQHPEEN